MADSHKYKVICAETRMCRMIAGLNLPLTAAKAITNNVKLMFPDSKIPFSIACRNIFHT